MKFFSPKKTAQLIALAGLAIVAWSFAYTNPSVSALETLTQQYRNGLNNVQSQLEQLNTHAAALKNNPKNIDNTRATFLQVRKYYKQVEFLLEYLDAQSVKDYLNGAPLPKIERNSPEMTVLQPHGMQVIEELLFADDAAQNAEELFYETNLLLTKFGQINKYQQRVPITERNLFEAARIELIRIITLGITGFDTPASNNALTDAKNALLPLQAMAKTYSPQLDAQTAAQLEEALSGAIQYLENNTDFDSFNRLEFIKNYINPAFKLFKKVHLQLGIETMYEVSSLPQNLNYMADDIFSTDLFDVNAFSLSGDRELNPDKVLLGKTLFFDPILSSNNKRSCASCHNPDKAFTDGEQRSVAMDFKGTVQRNAPTLINSVFAERYFYDLRTEKIENQFEHVITSALEFNTSYPQIAGKLSQSKQYKQMFATAFPQYNGQINKQTISEAIGAYLKTIVSYNSPFDKHIRGEENALSQQAINGFNLFMGKAVCGTCHFAPTFSGLVPPYYTENESEVLGVPATTDTLNPTLDPDIGRMGGRMREKVEFNRFAFKTVTVRNIALTSPYMHNGVYKTLEEVVDFYNKGGGDGLGIHLENQTLPFDNLSLTESEKKDLVAFMQSLTDTTGLTSKPATLPLFENNPQWNNRVVGGEY